MCLLHLVLLVMGIVICMESTVGCVDELNDGLSSATCANIDQQPGVIVGKFKDYNLDPWRFRFDRVVDQTFKVYIENNDELTNNPFMQLEHFRLIPYHSGKQSDDRIRDLFKGKQSTLTILKTRYGSGDPAHVLTVGHANCLDGLNLSLVLTPQLVLKNGTVVELPKIQATWPWKYGNQLGWGEYYRAVD